MIVFKHEQDICAICLEHKRFPVSLICGHSFCKSCIKIYMTYQDICNKCPLCRNTFGKKKLLNCFRFVEIVLVSVACGVLLYYIFS